MIHGIAIYFSVLDTSGIYIWISVRLCFLWSQSAEATSMTPSTMAPEINAHVITDKPTNCGSYGISFILEYDLFDLQESQI